MSEEEYKKAFSKNLRAYTEANGKTQADIVGIALIIVSVTSLAVNDVIKEAREKKK